MKRLWYVDNLRVFLISLVVLHHLAITYGAPGSWYYNESRPEGLLLLLLTMFVATNQAFFMGLFFLISAYFTEISLQRKGTGRFLADRLPRLLIPLLLYYFVISPGTIYFLARRLHDSNLSFPEFYLKGSAFGFGPLWFVETLLYFTLIYILFMKIKHRGQQYRRGHLLLPGDRWIVLLAVGTGLISFLTRLRFPVGWTIPRLGLQLSFFPQYLALFPLGILAARHNWLEQISPRRGLRWFLFAQAMILVAFPCLFILGGAATESGELFMGGWNWQSLGYSLWEQLTGLALMLGLLGIFRAGFNSQGRWGRELSACAYGVFVFHAPVVVLLTVGFRNIEIPGIMKLIVLAPLTVAASFLTAFLVRQIPFAKRIF